MRPLYPRTLFPSIPHVLRLVSCVKMLCFHWSYHSWPYCIVSLPHTPQHWLATAPCTRRFQLHVHLGINLSCMEWILNCFHWMTCNMSHFCDGAVQVSWGKNHMKTKIRILVTHVTDLHGREGCVIGDWQNEAICCGVYFNWEWSMMKSIWWTTISEWLMNQHVVKYIRD